MNREAYSVTIEELARRGAKDIPREALTTEHLVYSSPATLSYNSPGAQGFGVKRAGLAIPESVELVVSPACCGRNSTIEGGEAGFSPKIFFLRMDETDLVTGRHLTKIPDAVREIVDFYKPRPRVVVLCVTCADALLGTDMERVCRRAEEQNLGVRVIPTYMYALTRESIKPPMVAVRRSVYSLLEKPGKSITNDVLRMTYEKSLLAAGSLVKNTLAAGCSQKEKEPFSAGCDFCSSAESSGFNGFDFTEAGNGRQAEWRSATKGGAKYERPARCEERKSKDTGSCADSDESRRTTENYLRDTRCEVRGARYEERKSKDAGSCADSDESRRTTDNYLRDTRCGVQGARCEERKAKDAGSCADSDESRRTTDNSSRDTRCGVRGAKCEHPSANLLGFFAPLFDSCEIYPLLKQLGYNKINEISRCKSFEEYRTLADAELNIVLYPESVLAAEDLRQKLGTGYVELKRLYQADKIHKQYALFAAALGKNIDDGEFYDAAREKVHKFKEKFAGASFSFGQTLNGEPFEMALAFARYGFKVDAIFSNLNEGSYPYIRQLALVSPDTKLYLPASPTMLSFKAGSVNSDFSVGRDVAYYLPDSANVPWNSERQPFGFDGLVKLLDALEAAAKGGAKQ